MRTDQQQISLKIPWAARVAFQLYRFILFPILFLCLHLFYFFLPKKIKQIISQKNSLSQKIVQTQIHKPIWIHASSGEIEYAKSVIRDLKRQYPEIPILVTYSSVSIEKLIQKMPEIDEAVMAPWEFPSSVHFFIEKFKPRCLLIARTDAWPELTYQSHKKKIPTLMFAATLSQGSSRSRGLAKLINQLIFLNLDQIFCVSPEDHAEFKKIHPDISVQVAGDSRYDQVLYRLSHPQNLKNEWTPAPNQSVFVAGSTWPEDEAVLFPVIQKFPSMPVILAPHEINKDHLDAIEKQLSHRQISWNYYSQNKMMDKQVLIIDQVGILADIYRWGDMAFVGGSMKSKVHSVMEPLAHGLSVLVGPHYHNNREAIEFSKIGSPRFVQPISDELTLEQAIETFMKLSAEEKKDRRHHISQAVQARSGATEQVLGWVQRHID